MHLRFQTTQQYLFIHHFVKHLLVIWSKERRKDIYLVMEEHPDELTIKYPGETYREHVLQELEAVFFQTLETDQERFPVHLVATFLFQKRLIGIYFEPTREHEQPYLFEIVDETIKELTDHEYEDAWLVACNDFPEYFQSGNQGDKNES